MQKTDKPLENLPTTQEVRNDDLEHGITNESEETEPLLNVSVARISPYNACVPLFIQVFAFCLSVVSTQQWLLLHICSMSSEMKVQSLPGWNAQNLSPGADWDTCFDCKVERSVGTHDANTSALRWTLLGLGFRLFWSETYSFNGCGICVPLFLCYSWNHLFWIWIVAPIFGTQFVSFNSVLQGCMGSWYVGLVSMMSYFADTTTPEERNSVFVRGEAFLFLAFALGPYTGGLLSRLLPNGVQDVFLISLIGELLCVVYIILFLPESLKLTERKNSTSIVKIVKSSFSTLVTIFKWSNSSLVCVIVTTTLVGAALIGKGQFFYFVAFKFGWDSYDEGLFMMTSSLIRTFYMLAIFPLLVRLFSKLRSEKEGRLRFDLNLIRICLVIAALTSVALGVVPNSIGLYITSIFDGFVILASPILRSLVSNSVHSSQSAQLFSSVQFLEQAVGLVFGILFPLIWANSVGWMPNLILLMCGALYGLAALVMTFAGSEVVLV